MGLEVEPSKVDILRKILNRRRKPIPITELVKETGIVYPAVKRLAKKWGYKIEKEKVYIERIVSVVKKNDGMD